MTAAAVALAVSVSAISAGASDDKKASHNTPSAYSLSFPPHGPVCSSSSNAQAVAEAIHGNPFAAFAGSGAYSALFFNGNQGVSGGGGGSLASVTSSGSMAESGASTGAPAVILVPSTPGTVNASQTAAAPLVTTTQLGGVVAQSTPSATPEPATLFLIGAGLGGVLMSRRRNRKAD
jgi:hypothetical protein